MHKLLGSNASRTISFWFTSYFFAVNDSCNRFVMDKLPCMEAMVEQVLTCRRFRADRRRRAVGLVIVLSVIAGVRAWNAPPSSEMPTSQPPVATPEAQEPIVPLPLTVDQNPAKVALGERLFHDVRLSRDNSMSCVTCHQLERGGDDALPRSRTAAGNLLHRNAPTVFNVALNLSFNWDGGVPSLEVQAERVLLNPKVMNNTKSLPEQARQAQHGRWKALRPMALGHSSVPAHHPGRVRGDDGVISRGEP